MALRVRNVSGAFEKRALGCHAREFQNGGFEVATFETNFFRIGSISEAETLVTGTG